MMHRATVDQTKAPELARDVKGTHSSSVMREARAVPPGLVFWSDELEKRKTAVARWRGVTGACGSERPQHMRQA